eukprot:CAMPEP_0204525186 /NCGR_PEP_ID=MMETSP0661-20131031/7776_1 /ASSEMBLY_ACC=CAM_ASM_000606 /TAXON_ID=109239 /ORGANISM="Alexandrium margalefi, Strain AMGDE01CS-322" /LENGTH=193 /DNA_ID=CAMNT_0051530971 /DNA_START=46 /DNA_END=624 /DNA_ORIENTATION=-
MASPSTQKAEETKDSSDACEERLVPLCRDQAEWLDAVAERYNAAGSLQWSALELLVNLANAEPPQTKKMIFLVVRCHRCLQHTRGGEKRECGVRLPELQWRWLESVRERCGHPTVGKTLRIIVDFYRPILERDPDLERRVFAASAAESTGEQTTATEAAAAEPEQRPDAKALPGDAEKEKALPGASEKEEKEA